jgi:hypothetical protein
MKRVRKRLGDSILLEEVKTDNSRMRMQAMVSTNEGSFKTPEHFTPTKKVSGTNSKSTLNTSGSSMTSQPQAN